MGGIWPGRQREVTACPRAKESRARPRTTGRLSKTTGGTRLSARAGDEQEKAARIANTPASVAGKRGGKAKNYDDMTKDEYHARAKKVGVPGRSSMNKKELMSALRKGK